MSRRDGTRESKTKQDNNHHDNVRVESVCGEVEGDFRSLLMRLSLARASGIAGVAIVSNLEIAQGEEGRRVGEGSRKGRRCLGVG